MQLSNLFRKKSIEKIKSDAEQGFIDAEHNGTGLRRSLGRADLTLMGIAAIIGAGIFAMIGKASSDGGPAVIFLFIFTAIACAFSALCYAEFASRIPVAGSAYTYSYASLGELVAWIIGWDLIVEYAIGNIAVAISWSDYFTGMLKGLKIPWLGINGINIPLHFTMDYVTASKGFNAVTEALTKGGTVEALTKACELKDAVVSCAQIDAYSAFANSPKLGSFPVIMDLPALLITVSITALVFIGIREAKIAGNILTVLKIAVILMVIVLGAMYVVPDNWSPFAPNGFTGVMKGVSAVFFAYIGFDALSTTAEECKDPHKDLPRAMIYSLIICTILYITLALVLTGMMSYTKLNVGDPLAFVFGPEGANIPIVAGIISVSAVIALATVFLVFQIGQPRLWMAMSRDGLLPRVFSSIHPKFKTPWFATIITGLVVAIPALFMNLTEVTDLASIGTLFAFLVVCAGVLFKDKEFGREKRYVPYINSEWIIPILVVLGMGLFIYFNDTSVVWNYLSLNPIENETMLQAFSHKIPLISFILLLGTMIVLCVSRKLSLIPVLGVLSCAYLMTELGWTNWFRFGIWLLLGIRIYRAYGYRNSNLNEAKNAAPTLLRIASVLADFVLLSFVVFPLLEWMISFPLPVWLNVVAAAFISVAIDLVTRIRERKIDAG